MGLQKKQFLVHNNVKLASLEENRCRYAFVDSTQHHADRILMGSLIPMRFEAVEEPVQVEGFELRIGSFKSRYENWFLCCMSDLEWVLQIEGNYIQACEQLLGASVVIREELAKLSEQNKRAAPFAPTANLKILGVAVADC